MKFIESKENPTFKEILRIKKNASKSNTSSVYLEGLRLSYDAIISGVKIKTIILSNKVYYELSINDNKNNKTDERKYSHDKKINDCETSTIIMDNTETIKISNTDTIKMSNTDTIKMSNTEKNEISEIDSNKMHNLIKGLLHDECVEIIVLKDSLFAVMTSTNSPQGIASIVLSPVIQEMNAIEIKSSDKFMICESVQDPGNFGSIIRSADAFGFAGIIFTSDTANPFNEKVLRSSMGSVFHINLIESSNIIDTINILKSKGVTVYASHLNGENITKDLKFSLPCAIVMGNEGNGISKLTSDNCDKLIKIPMPGNAQSLNVSNAAAILCYHATIS